ncbi:MAG: TIGR02391 family protein [Candidatus Woesebacteria bacterium]|nr:MAG: TIGR02391 family protein [Candidatus Woesebacteria bacterium]
MQKLERINRYNYTLSSGSDIRDYAGDHLSEFQKRLTEAFIWLEREMFIAPKPDETGEWRYITRRGERVLQSEDFASYAKESLLQSDQLHPVLVRKVKQLFLRGDYDTAIFQAFKAVEVAVRKAGKYEKSDIGVPLMRKAFNPNTGTLTNSHSESSEKEAMSNLFAGAIGLFKNPASHRDIEGITPEEASDYIRVANCLIKMVDSEK